MQVSVDFESTRKTAKNSTLNEDDNIMKDHREKWRVPFTNDDWFAVDLMVSLLEPFAKAQNYLEGGTYVTLSALPTTINLLRTNIESTLGNILLSEEYMNKTLSEGNVSLVEELNEVVLKDFNRRWGSEKQALLKECRYITMHNK